MEPQWSQDKTWPLWGSQEGGFEGQGEQWGGYYHRMTEWEFRQGGLNRTEKANLKNSEERWRMVINFIRVCEDDPQAYSLTE